MKEDSWNLMKNEEKEQLLNIAAKDLINIGQLLQVETKEEQLLSVAVDDHQLLRDINLEDIQDKEDWLIIDAEEESDEDCAEMLREVPKEMADLWHELNLLEHRLEKQRVHIQVAKWELNGDEEIVKDINKQIKPSGTFVLGDWNNHDEDKIGVKKNQALMSRDDGGMLYEVVKQKIVLRDNEETEIIKCNLKAEMVCEIRKVGDYKQY